jgi:hypothetical protein
MHALDSQCAQLTRRTSARRCCQCLGAGAVDNGKQLDIGARWSSLVCKQHHTQHQQTADFPKTRRALSYRACGGATDSVSRSSARPDHRCPQLRAVIRVFSSRRAIAGEQTARRDKLLAQPSRVSALPPRSLRWPLSLSPAPSAHTGFDEAPSALTSTGSSAPLSRLPSKMRPHRRLPGARYRRTSAPSFLQWAHAPLVVCTGELQRALLAALPPVCAGGVCGEPGRVFGQSFSLPGEKSKWPVV